MAASGVIGSCGERRVVAGYRLLRLLGQGAHGSVFLADAGGHAVALKVLALPQGDGFGLACERFLASAATARRLVHPGIVAVLAAGVEGANGWLAMEPVIGGDLGRHVRPGCLLPARQALVAAHQLALALECAHRQGVVHRDLKPANVLIEPRDGSVKLADFGLARAFDAEQSATGFVLGSPSYMAPEQLAGNVPTPQSDLYALGVMLFELLTGRLPHEGSSMGELLRNVVSQPAPALDALRPDLPAAVAAVVASLLAKGPAQRPASATATAAALQSALLTLPEDGGAAPA